jgi:hypothetical protein
MRPQLSAGYYSAEVEELGFRESQSGKDMITLKVRILGELADPWGSAADFYATDQTPTRFINLVVNDDRSLDFILKKLRYAGWNGTDFATLEPDMIGAYVKVQCKHTPNRDTGEAREDWDLMLPPRSNVPLDADGDKARRLNALFDRRLTDPAFNLAPQGDQAPAPSRGPQGGGGGSAPPHDDGDIPF